MLEWITAPKKQSVLEVKLLPGDPAREDTLIHIPYSKLIDSTLADRSSAGAVILRGCLKSPANSKFTECGIGFIPGLL